MAVANFDLEEVLDIERDELTHLSIERPSTLYFLEPVAQSLYAAFQQNPNDHRLLIYTFPLIQSVMVKHVASLKLLEQEEGEIFNTLCLNLLTAFTKYSVSRGRLFTYCTLILHFRIKDLKRNKHSEVEELKDWDMAISDDGFHVLEDFKAFLRKFAVEQGPTAKKQISALLEILECPKAQALCQSQERIKQEICRRTSLPMLVVEPYYKSLLTRFEHSILD